MLDSKKTATITEGLQVVAFSERPSRLESSLGADVLR